MILLNGCPGRLAGDSNMRYGQVIEREISSAGTSRDGQFVPKEWAIRHPAISEREIEILVELQSLPQHRYSPYRIFTNYSL